MDDDFASVFYVFGLGLVAAWIYVAVAVALALTFSIGTLGSIVLAVGFVLVLVLVLPKLPHPVPIPEPGTSVTLDGVFLVAAVVILVTNVWRLSQQSDALGWLLLFVGVAAVAVGARNFLPHVW